MVRRHKKKSSLTASSSTTPVAGPSRLHITSMDISPQAMEAGRAVQDAIRRSDPVWAPGLTYPLDTPQPMVLSSLDIMTTCPTLIAPLSSGREYMMYKKLPRPAGNSISNELLGAANPTLADVPPAFVQDTVREKQAPLFLHAMDTATVVEPKIRQLGKKLKVRFKIDKEMSDFFPTHVLALTKCPSQRKWWLQGPQSEETDAVTLHLTHSVVLASSCPSFPPHLLQPPPDQTSVNVSRIRTLPVIALSLPFPSHFTALHFYLYSRHVAGLIAALISLPQSVLEELFSRQNDIDVPKIIQHLIDKFDLPTLTTMRCHISYVWANAFALEIWDGRGEFWDIIDFCWIVVLEAHHYMTRRRPI